VGSGTDRHRLHPGRRTLLVVLLALGLATVVSVTAHLLQAPRGAGSPSPGARTSTPEAKVPKPVPGERKVFAHYFPPQPVSIDNAPPAEDYYARELLAVDGEGGKHATYGGYLRDRPAVREPLSGDWRAADLRSEVADALTGGIDGFTVDILGLSGQNWDATVALMAAAAASDRPFSIVPNVDANGSAAASSPAVVAAKLAELYASPAAYRLPDGRHVLSSFKAEGKAVSWWSETIRLLAEEHDVEVAFVAVLLEASDSNLVKFAPISYALSDWGGRTVAESELTEGLPGKARSLGARWMAPVAVQDMRPRNGVYAEAGNTETLRAMWRRAIGDQADFVQLVTWNDYSETTAFAPSVHHGRAFLALNAHYAREFKGGAGGAVEREQLVLSHRTQFHAARPRQGIRFEPTLGGATTPPRDTVEVVALLSAPATITVTVGGTEHRSEAPAGLAAFTYPLELGEVVAVASRPGAEVVARVSSPFPVVSDPPVSDLQYVAAVSDNLG